MTLFDRILASRGITAENMDSFLNPKYSDTYDPFLLPDMKKAVDRLVKARKKQEKITIYGDYDIDGLTSSTLLYDALKSFGFNNVDVFIPNRFVDGYGLSMDAVKKIAQDKTSLVITVDCGSLSEKEIIKANELGMDIIVTDHHGVADIQPPAVAVINPKRHDSIYPFRDLASVGVAFKLIQALQTEIDGLPVGQEKWLLDLVALGTVCDVVELVDENRIFAYWGIEVMKKTKRQGLKALMAVAKIEPSKLGARSLGFGLGPRLNAAGRLETARHALDLLMSDDAGEALELAYLLDEMNRKRRFDQDKIFKEAIKKAENYKDDPVLVLVGDDWNHGIVGIVAAKILEKYKKPAIILQQIDDVLKGSARSFGDFHIADAIRANQDLISSGGGHKFAAGVSLPSNNLEDFRRELNRIFKSKHNLLIEQDKLVPSADAIAGFDEITLDLIDSIAKLEPFGHGNLDPIIKSQSIVVANVKKMGDSGQHLKLCFKDNNGNKLDCVAFNAPDYFCVEVGMIVDASYQPILNEWQGNKSVEGKLVDIKACL